MLYSPDFHYRHSVILSRPWDHFDRDLSDRLRRGRNEWEWGRPNRPSEPTLPLSTLPGSLSFPMAVGDSEDLLTPWGDVATEDAPE